MTQRLHRLRELTSSYPVPAEAKLEHRLESLNRMREYYESRMAIVPEKQFRLFREFIIAIVYAITMIKLYRKLTKRLAAELEQVEAQDGKDNPT